MRKSPGNSTVLGGTATIVLMARLSREERQRFKVMCYRHTFVQSWMTTVAIDERVLKA